MEVTDYSPIAIGEHWHLPRSRRVFFLKSILMSIQLRRMLIFMDLR